jgi:3-(3-hydroxy-phenyl)propionate hydroxylase
MLANGCLLDTALGLNFSVIGDPAVLAGVSNDTRERWLAQSVYTMPTQDPALQDWLKQQGVCAVLLRPDRYVMGVAQTCDELDRISALLPGWQVLPH